VARGVAAPRRPRGRHETSCNDAMPASQERGEKQNAGKTVG